MDVLEIYSRHLERMVITSNHDLQCCFTFGFHQLDKVLEHSIRFYLLLCEKRRLTDEIRLPYRKVRLKGSIPITQPLIVAPREAISLLACGFHKMLVVEEATG